MESKFGKQTLWELFFGESNCLLFWDLFPSFNINISLKFIILYRFKKKKKNLNVHLNFASKPPFFPFTYYRFFFVLFIVPFHLY